MNKKNKIDFRLEAQPQEGKTVIYLYGDIVDERPIDYWTGEPLEGDYITPKEVRGLLDGIEDEKIELHINSYGGSVFASVAIFNYLKALNKDLTTINDGLCASGASLIFMAGNKRIMPKNTVLMIHRASSYGWGNCNDLRELADTLEKLDSSTVYETDRTTFTGTDEEWSEIISGETWITADESLSYGLCSEVAELGQKEPNEEPNKDPKEEPTNAEVNKGISLMRNFANLKFKGELDK